MEKNEKQARKMKIKKHYKNIQYIHIFKLLDLGAL